MHAMSPMGRLRAVHLPRSPRSSVLYTHRSLLSSRSMSSSLSSSSIYVVPIDPTAPSNNTSSTTLDVDKLLASTPKSTKPSKAGTTHVFYGTPPGSITTLVSLGGQWSGASSSANTKRELVRTAVGSAVQVIKGLGEGVEGREVRVDVGRAGVDGKDVAVAANLALYKFDLKTKEGGGDPRLSVVPLGEESGEAWKEGEVYAEAQNLARTLMELPANMLTPTVFAERIQSEFSGVGNAEVVVRDAEWAKEKGMNSFLSVTKGSAQSPKFVEIHYRGAADKNAAPLVFVGKGITFDSGGISLKPGAGMKLMRGDMGGAATVVSAALAVAKLQLPINLTVVTPLTENMPGPAATKPGDVVYAMNGTSIEVDNTDAEGRLILADALYYATTEFKPQTVIDVATLTGAIDIALGEIYTGVFTNSDSLWSSLNAAGEAEHDLLWRMPLSEDYAFQIRSSNADLCNVGGRPAGACTAALFLKSFVPGLEGEESKEGKEEGKVRWAHVDIAGTMEATKKGAYQESGMTGRPTRALITFAKSYGQV
ncbi:cytosol aminopeptidase family, catalytic domain-containing protein [Irpex rosettiformis]|uniref:Cytosol aminopeptidase family, catalytic domain-containing protein n=1 Tax=Irpex rosettiformis TaxID=378272 RepID=A0ACB8TMW4_9APHY|nr:cytosol aminopeptidase family, catalytic domain-containing protein [Irpex rosettiformis]